MIVLAEITKKALDVSNCMSLTKTIDSLLLRYGVNFQGSTILGNFLYNIHASRAPPVSMFPYINEHVCKLLAYGATVNNDEFISATFWNIDLGYTYADKQVKPWMTPIVEMLQHKQYQAYITGAAERANLLNIAPPSYPRLRSLMALIRVQLYDSVPGRRLSPWIASLPPKFAIPTALKLYLTHGITHQTTQMFTSISTGTSRKDGADIDFEGAVKVAKM